MAAERMFVTKERVIRNSELVHGVGTRIPYSRAVELGLTDDELEPVAERSIHTTSRVRKVPEKPMELEEDSEPEDELETAAPEPAPPPARKAQRMRRVPTTVRNSELNVKPQEDRSR